MMSVGLAYVIIMGGIVQNMCILRNDPFEHVVLLTAEKDARTRRADDKSVAERTRESCKQRK